MKFKEAETTENFPLRRLVSKEGIWEIGLTPMLFGVRVRFGKVGAVGVVLDYCAGSDPKWQIRILGIVTTILLGASEDVEEEELARTFPVQTIKPMANDKKCFESLLRLVFNDRIHV